VFLFVQVQCVSKQQLRCWRLWNDDTNSRTFQYSRISNRQIQGKTGVHGDRIKGQW